MELCFKKLRNKLLISSSLQRIIGKINLAISIYKILLWLNLFDSHDFIFDAFIMNEKWMAIFTWTEKQNN